ncbi:uncharacterized protein CCHa2 isoform X1 [Euwallacea fornicatus]|uniref:uncharacterized protein CCHa2 isoform X1 n=1 Tax=Euwallacea fornicatus TaxID=995702 RepID=UPI00338EDE9A
MICLSYKFNYIFQLIIVISFFISQAHGRIGCASFGHSCYGGQGKRSSLEHSEPNLVPNVPVLEESDPGIHGLRELREQSEFVPVLGSLGTRRFTLGQYAEMNKFVKEWIINYLKNDKALM